MWILIHRSRIETDGELSEEVRKRMKEAGIDPDEWVKKKSIKLAK